VKGPIWSPLALVVEPNDAGRIRLRRSQLEGGVNAVGEQSLAAAECEWIEQQVELVHQVVLQEVVNEDAAAVGEDVLSRLRLQRADRLDHVVANDGRVAPGRFFQCA
jgi:hypothetical protein